MLSCNGHFSEYYFSLSPDFIIIFCIQSVLPKQKIQRGSYFISIYNQQDINVFLSVPVVECITKLQ